MAFSSCTKYRLLLASLICGCVAAAGMGADGTFTVALRPAAFTINPGPQGVTLTCAGVSYLGRVGEPNLPWVVSTLQIPADADPLTLQVRLARATWETVPGSWAVAPVPPLAAWKDGRHVIEPAGEPVVAGRDTSIYEQDADWPPAAARLLSIGQLRGYRLVQAAVPLVRYNPRAATLNRLISADLAVTWSPLPADGKAPPAPPLRDKIGDATVRRLADNAADDPTSEPGIAGTVEIQETGGPAGYVIITTSAIQAASTSLADFVADKQLAGFSVQVITESQFGGGTGDAAAENIRRWLQAHYLDDQIQYVLLIGDQDMDTGEVPMKRVWPRSASDEAAPTDYYYADLTGNWDLDADGAYGEFDGGDFGIGGVDRFYEVIVGRIPYYGSIEDLDGILQQAIAYRNAPPATLDWRKQVLLPMRPSDEYTPGYHLGEQIKNDLLAPKGWPFHRIYDSTFGLTPPPETTPCTYTSVQNTWAGGAFGMVVWWAHGSYDWADNILSSGGAQNLNGLHPAFTFQASCDNARPEQANNLAYALLRNGGIVTVGATRVSYYFQGQGIFNGTATNAGMAYEYASRVIGARTTGGFALHDLRQRIYASQWELWMNYVCFNIYGDPSLPLLPLQARRYVRANAPAGGDGQSWATAYRDLQSALSDAPVEIWVAAGTYKPDRGTANRTYAFQLINGVALYGGFTGTETTVFQRDPRAHETILSGDLGGNDLAGFVNRAENSYHVVTARNTNATAVLDGFVISGGAANGSSANTFGGGLYIETSGSPTIRNCTFRDNLAKFGGAMSCSTSSSPLLINCVIRGNQADLYGTGSGGGLYAKSNSAPVLTDCIVAANTAASTGGGIFYATGSPPTLTNCTLIRSYAPLGGGVYGNNDSTPFAVKNCIFWDNTRYVYGLGAVADQLAQIANAPGLDIDSSCLQGWTGSLGGIGNIGDDPLIIDADGPDNILGTPDDNLRLRGDSPCLDTGDNTAIPAWLLTDVEGRPRIQNGTVDMGAYEGGHQAFIVDTDSLSVPEGQTATFSVRLAVEPSATLAVAVARTTGDESVSISSGATLTFDASDYAVPQTVEVAAAEDTDNLDGTAMIRVTADGVAPAAITTHAVDNDPVPDTLHVDLDAPGLNHGATWAGAYTDLQTALAVADAHTKVTEIRVAEGIYRPAPAGGNRLSSFLLRSHLALRGGFAGYGQPDPDQRDFAAHATVLSGDLNADDEPGFTNNSENSYHVVQVRQNAVSVDLDGLTIAAGNANGAADYYGAGLLIWGIAQVAHCTFVGNRSDQAGGAVACYADSTFVNCVFNGNLCSDRGAALANAGYNLQIINSTLHANKGYYTGGLFAPSGTTTITNSIFWGNTTTTSEYDQRAQLYGSNITVNYSCVQGWTSGGTANLDADPRFTDPIGLDGIAGTTDDQLGIAAGSPCIDAGNNAAVLAGQTIDMTCGPRFYDDPNTTDTGNGSAPVVDMGAYEYHPIPEIPFDFDGDGDVDHADLEIFRACSSGPAVQHNGQPFCQEADADADEDVDIEDYGVFQRCYSGENQPADPNCAH